MTDRKLFLIGLLLLQACGRAPAVHRETEAFSEGKAVAAVDTLMPSLLEASGLAEPLQRATLSTRLMGSVTEVLVREGDHVTAGQLLVRLDARDLAARRTQVDAGLAEAEAVHRDALTQATRFRALYADSAATRYQLDQAETGLSRAEAALSTARAAGAELAAVGSYAEIRAPFAGVVTRRQVDPGAFAAPGTPLVEVQDPSRLRLSVSITPTAAAGLRRGATVQVKIEDTLAVATVEGSVPAAGGGLYTLNAVVDNRDGRFLPGSAASVLIPGGMRRAVLIPAAAIVREGDLTGVDVVGPVRSERRWLRLGHPWGDQVEVLAGLAGGERVLARD